MNTLYIGNNHQSLLLFFLWVRSEFASLDSHDLIVSQTSSEVKYIGATFGLKLFLSIIPVSLYIEAWNGLLQEVILLKYQK